VISGNKEPWFEGIVRGGFGIPHTFNRPDRPPNETFADRIAEMLERTFTDAGSQVTVVRLARGSTQPAARGKLKPQTKDAALLIRIHDSRFDAGGFRFDYPYHFQLSVLDREGNTLAQASVQGRDAHTPSGKYNVWDMYGVVYRDKFEQLLVKPEIQLAIASPSRTVPVEKHTVSVEQAETETVGKNTESVSEATAITSGLLAQSEQETQRRKQDAIADSKAVAESLAALKILHDQGVLSDEEYMQKQRGIIHGGLSTGRKQDAAADSKAVAESLAALKSLHEQGVLSDEEYMRKQREVINEQTRGIRAELGAISTVAAAPAAVSDESATTSRFHVALLPIANLRYSDFDVIFYDYVHEYVERNPDMRLVYSEFDQQFERGRAGTMDTLWRGTFTSKTPDKTSAMSGAKRVGANVAVLISYKKRTAGWYGEEFSFDIYVYDVEAGKVHRKSGNELNYEKVIDAAFASLMSDRRT
jgi:hypothetical protein